MESEEKAQTYIVRDALVDLMPVIGGVMVAVKSLQLAVTAVRVAVTIGDRANEGWQEAIEEATVSAKQSGETVNEAFTKLVAILERLGTPSA
jgi:hypothetical protein